MSSLPTTSSDTESYDDDVRAVFSPSYIDVQPQHAAAARSATPKGKKGFQAVSTVDIDAEESPINALSTDIDILPVKRRTTNGSFHSPTFQSLSTTAPTSASALPTIAEPTGLRSFKGILMVAISTICFSLMSMFVSLSSQSQHVPSFQILFVRCIIQTVGSTIACGILRINPLGPSDNWQLRGWLWLRGAVGIISMSALYYSVTAISLPDATVLFFLSPIYAGILGRLWLGEPWDLIDNLFALVSIGGCILVARPSFIFGTDAATAAERDSMNGDGHTRMFGVMVSVLGAILTACVFIVIRKIGHSVHPQVLTLYTGLVGLVPYTPIMMYYQGYVPPSEFTLQTWMYMIAVGLCALVGQGFFNYGVQLEKAGVAAMTRNLDVVLVFIWQSTILRQSINPLSIAGAALMTCAVFAVGVKKIVMQQRQKKATALVPVT